MKVIAIIAAYNEERYIGPCIEHLHRQGIEVYLIDNDSTDHTTAIAKRYLHNGVISIETIPRDVFRLLAILQRKEQLASILEADWFLHLDADEIPLPPRSNSTLAQAFAEVERQGYNAVNFQEYAFIPTQEAPDHDHSNYQETMRSYYAHVPATFPYRLRAWKRQLVPVELAWSGGHLIRFPGLRMYPQTFPMRHYPFLSIAQAVSKYGAREHDPNAVKAGFHTWRARFEPAILKLPSQADLQTYVSDDQLNTCKSRNREYLAELHDLSHWFRQIPLAAQEIAGLIPIGETVILIDEDRLREDLTAGRRSIPFTEKNGQYWGPPDDDSAAINEFIRLWRSGAQFVVIAWPAFWWLDHFAGFREFLYTHFPCALRNERLIVFNLRSSAPAI
jgi:Glycosyl transferase family 2